LQLRNGAAVNETELVAPERRDRPACHTRSGFGAVGRIEEVFSVELIVAQKIPQSAAILVGSGACAHDDLSAAATSVFGRIGVCQDFEFLKTLDADLDLRAVGSGGAVVDP